MPKVSIVMPCYNQEQYIGTSIDSVLGQIVSDWELIAVDDGSTDGSIAALAAGHIVIFYSPRQRGDWRAIAESFAHAVPHNRRWLRNRGVVKMWLTGLASYARIGTQRLPTGKGAKDLAGAPP